jgi:hypothetical protein
MPIIFLACCSVFIMPPRCCCPLFLQVSDGIPSLIKVLYHAADDPFASCIVVTLALTLTPRCFCCCCCLGPCQVSDGIPSLIKVLSKSMDSSLTSDKVELATVTRDDATGKVRPAALWHAGVRCLCLLLASLLFAWLLECCCFNNSGGSGFGPSAEWTSH